MEYLSEWWNEILCTYLDGSRKIEENSGDINVNLDTFSLSNVTVGSIGEFVCFMENVLRGGYGDIIRAKGSISLKEGSITFDVAGGRYSILLDEEKKDSKAIFIGNRIRKQRIRKILFKKSESIKILPFRRYSSAGF